MNNTPNFMMSYNPNQPPIHKPYSIDKSQNKDFLGEYDFILAYRDTGSSEVTAITCNSADTENLDKLISKAHDFFRRNLGYHEVNAKWVKSNCDVQSLFVRVITAKKNPDDQEKILFISKASKVWILNAMAAPIACESSPISIVTDIEQAIQGFIVSGDLCCSSDALARKGETIDNTPMIVFATLTKSNRDSYKPNPIPDSKYISRMFSNDQMQMYLEYRGGGDFNYSSTAHLTRHKKLKEVMNNSNYNEALIINASENIWLHGGFYDSSHARNAIKRKETITESVIRNTLIFSNAFLSQFITASKRKFSISIRDVAGAENASYIEINTGGTIKNSLFMPPAIKLFTTNDYISIENPALADKADINKIILDGWQVDYDVNQHSRGYNLSFDENVSKENFIGCWLYTLLRDMYFKNASIDAEYIRPKFGVRSKFITKAFLDYNDINWHDDNGRFVYLYSKHLLPICSMSFVMGTILFSIRVKKDKKYIDYTLSQSYGNEGFIADIVSYTILMCIDGEISTIFCLKDIDTAIDMMISSAVDSDDTLAYYMDRFDVIREITTTASMLGFTLNINFNHSYI